ncbi:DUF3322 domain-containing protein [Uliginosibacterium sp. H3]|uniref:DUF3322 domain-containing protein n=1 Tax=Uliginosibacterium silvisoli TaxID=3114758 RepID=A0ABU6K8Y7_9RHOO|nr:DUF3322 domain-containing protein [Uliginosibacterium sp. H3]
MSWSSPKDLKAQVARLWDQGELLRDVVTCNKRFPLRLALKSPASADITNRFELVRAWATELAAATSLRIEWQDIRHRVQGQQKMPASVWVATIADAVAWLGKHEEWNRFAGQVATTRQHNPALLPWLEKRPLQALALEPEWPRLLTVVDWLSDHPRPGIYLRQVDIPGIHSKFIEGHRGVLTELLDLALPAGAVDFEKSGITQFSGRYGFLDKPIRIRFRVLDAAIRAVAGPICPDVAIDADSFSHLNLAVKRVFITENETNFLAFPQATDAIAIFGAGYGWEALARTCWLNDCEIYYWGDIDTHGFGILNQLRGKFSHVNSFLMDRATLEAHSDFWGHEGKQLQVDLHRLTREERNLYDDLRDNRIRVGVRLEQEHVGFHWLTNYLETLFRVIPK